nr:MAG: E1B 55K [unidentified adenovirus]
MIRKILPLSTEGHPREMAFFEEIRPRVVRPNEDLQAVINMNYKIELLPNAEYVLRAPIIVTRLLYVIGNHATVRILGSFEVMFDIRFRERQRMRKEMQRGVFRNVFFEGDGFSGNLFKISTSMTFHSCTFRAFGGIVIDAALGVTVQGCVFNNCAYCVYGHDNMKLNIRYNHFEDCNVCINSKSPVVIKNNVAVHCACFCTVSDVGVIKRNTVLGLIRDVENPTYQLVTCAEKCAFPLHTIHVSSCSHGWPEFIQNNFSFCSIFLAHRSTTVCFMKCMISDCHILFDCVNPFNSCLLNGFVHRSVIGRILQFHPNQEGEEKPCLCGSAHHLPNIITCAVNGCNKEEPLLYSCLKHDLSSEDDE